MVSGAQRVMVKHLTIYRQEISASLTIVGQNLKKIITILDTVLIAPVATCTLMNLLTLRLTQDPTTNPKLTFYV